MKHHRLPAWRCAHGHVQLHEAAACPACGAPLLRGHVNGAARLIASTTVRVNPSGRPFILGVAVTRCGRARTLCVVEAPVRGTGHDAVWLCSEEGRVVARSRVRARLSADNPAGSARREDSRRS